MDNDEIVSAVPLVASETIYQQDKAVIDMQVTTAKMYPRNVLRSTQNAIATVTMDKETAATCTYSVPRSGKVISGPSVHLAKMVAQYWGNLRIEAKVIDIGQTQLTSQAIVFDLENNIAMKIEVRRSITGSKGRFSEDMITVTGNAANSIALRNAIFAVIPKAVVDKVYKAARDMITGDISEESKLVAKRKQVLDGFKDAYKVTEEEVLSAIGKASITHITPDDLVVLIGIGQAIKDGDTTVDEAFKGKNSSRPEAITIEELKSLFEQKKHLLNATTRKSVERVIDNQEVLSYKKVKLTLENKNDSQ